MHDDVVFAGLLPAHPPVGQVYVVVDVPVVSEQE
ncbi:hypothetical protein BN8_p06893 (plasmid) [Fibrisoma limi BUZ 3]|uniref:Uncharacterized protein n=1 Tax=Fibrisoma limi BUZ 3 TaxID=1185876 RepID=I2GU83_9BACT|nr:hypothetical protein BN8_p06893 [Fibrisoma limi BUZ 3]